MEVAQLCKACSHGQMDVIDSLLNSGVDVNVPNNDLFPLQHACKTQASCILDVVTKLVTHGADVDLENRLGLCVIGKLFSTPRCSTSP